MRNIYIIHRQIYRSNGDRLGFGGIENYIFSLASVFKAQGWKTILVQPAKSAFTITKDNMEIHGVNTGWMRGNLKKHALSQWAKQHANKQTDVILFATDSYATNCPDHHSVAIQHGVSWDKPAKGNNSITRFVSSFINNIKYLSYIKRDNKLVCVDHNFVNWYRTWFNIDKDNVQVIYNFYQQKISQPEFEKKWDNSSDALKLIIARRFVDYRGIALIAPIIKNLLATYPQLDVTFAGDGPLKPSLIEMFNNEERVTIGRYEPHECYAWHAAHHIAVVPTLGSEGTSLAMIEAMAAGCTVISSNVGGLSNLIIDEFNGRLVMPDAQSFHDAIGQAISNKATTKQMALNGMNSIEKPCSISHWGERWVNLINTFD